MNESHQTKQSILNYQAIFSEEEISILKTSLSTMSTKNRWKIVFTDNLLSFYRSSTGRRIYQIVLEKHASVYLVSTAYVNRNPQEYRIKDDDYDIALLDYLVRHVLLKQTLDFPMPKHIKKEDFALFKYIVVGS